MDPLMVKKVALGAGRPKICVPLISTGREALVQEAGRAAELPCQLLEWRADFFLEGLSGDSAQIKTGKLLQTLGDLRMAVEMPLIFTIRTEGKEGGPILPAGEYTALNGAAAESGLADFLDLEFSRVQGGETAMAHIIRACKRSGQRLLISAHDFYRTPPLREILRQFTDMQAMGPDLVKLAFMPRQEGDVETLLEACLLLRDSYAKTPFIAVSMGELGMASRVCAGEFGSAVTFAAGKKASAPGQIDAVTLDAYLSRYYERGDTLPAPTVL